ncbi:MAG: hypothetical protein AAFU77_02320 [Myxococcota bacterium]
MRSGRRWREAVHEAGHAVMAVLLGRPLVHARLDPQPETRLSDPVRLPKGRPDSSAERAHLEGEAMLALAGITAERVLGVTAEDSLGAARGDIEIATRVAALTAGASRTEKAVAHHLAVVERMLAKRKDTVQILAEALFDAGELTGSAIKELVPRR